MESSEPPFLSQKSPPFPYFCLPRTDTQLPCTLACVFLHYVLCWPDFPLNSGPSKAQVSSQSCSTSPQSYQTAKAPPYLPHSLVAVASPNTPEVIIVCSSNIIEQWERAISHLIARIDLNIIINQKMSQKRRASRHSRGEETLTKLKCFEALVGLNPYLIQEEVERAFKETLRRMLDDFVKTMVQHDLAQEMAGFKMEEHIASAVAFMEQELEKFSQWIENNIINKEEIRKAKEALDQHRRTRKEKIRNVMGLVLRLTESIRDRRVEEMEKLLEVEVEKYRIHEIKNIYEYDKFRSLQEKYQKVYDDHFEKVRQKYERICGKYEAKYSNH